MAGRVYNINEGRPPGFLRIGVDEAGYGPRLGPLVIAATAVL
ncbi:MAG: hypothetical protein HY718_04090 [Planctomycetes bacterium]|nr:hypothetical protein [Planctomycetota bacterium]